MAKTLLVVDDSRTVTTAVSWMLKNSQWTVLTAGASDEARDLVRTHDPDIVLIDYHLPDGSGLDLCRSLGSDPGTKARLVILGGTWHPFDPAEPAGAGAHGHLMKPFRSEALFEALENALSAADPDDVTLLVEPVQAHSDVPELDELDDDLLDLDDGSDLLILTAEHEAVDLSGQTDLDDGSFAAPLPIARVESAAVQSSDETTGEHPSVSGLMDLPDVSLEDEPTLTADEAIAFDEEPDELAFEEPELDEPAFEEPELDEPAFEEPELDLAPLPESEIEAATSAPEDAGTAPMPAALRQGGVIAPPPSRAPRGDAGLLRTPASLPRPTGLRGVAGPLSPPPPSRPVRQRSELREDEPEAIAPASEQTEQAAPIVPASARPSAQTPAPTVEARIDAPAQAHGHEAAEAPSVAVDTSPAPAEPAVASSEAQPVHGPGIDRDTLRALVKEALPDLVRDILAQLLREQLAERTDAYARGRIDAFVEKDLPGLAERTIEAFLNQNPE